MRMPGACRRLDRDMNEIGEMTTPYIPMYRPIIEREEFDACRESLENGWLGMGSYVAAFEAKLKECIGAPDRHVVAVSTGHAALHLGLLLIGVGPMWALSDLEVSILETDSLIP